MERCVALAALIDTSPDGRGTDGAWLDDQLARHWTKYKLQATPREREVVRAWSVGGVHGLETLVQARPVVRDPSASFISDFLRVPTQCTLAAYAVSDDPRAPLPRLDIARFQRWIGTCSEGDFPTSGDDASGAPATSRLRAALPGFLERSLRAHSAREIVFFSFLAQLHELGALGVTYADPDAIRRALEGLDARLGHPPRIHVMVADGKTVGILHRGDRLLQLTPPAAPRSRRSITGPLVDARHAPGSLLLLHVPGSGDDDHAALNVGEGVFTIQARAPVTLTRRA